MTKTELKQQRHDGTEQNRADLRDRRNENRNAKSDMGQNSAKLLRVSMKSLGASSTSCGQEYQQGSAAEPCTKHHDT